MNIVQKQKIIIVLNLIIMIEMLSFCYGEHVWCTQFELQ